MVPEDLKTALRNVVLTNNAYPIDVVWMFADGDSLPEPQLASASPAEQSPDGTISGTLRARPRDSALNSDVS